MNKIFNESYAYTIFSSDLHLFPNVTICTIHQPFDKLKDGWMDGWMVMPDHHVRIKVG